MVTADEWVYQTLQEKPHGFEARTAEYANTNRVMWPAAAHGVAMLPVCLILGDSIAAGTAAAIGARAGPACAVIARTGVSTSWAIRAIPSGRFETVILSVGSNDAHAPDLERRLASLRAGISASKVIWVVPYDRRAAVLVTRIARANGDRWLELAELPSADRVHPYRYAPLAVAAAAAIGLPALDRSARDRVGEGATPVSRWVIAPTSSSVTVFK